MSDTPQPAWKHDGVRVIPGVVGYTAAKAGLIQMTRQLAVELARHGIRANALAGKEEGGAQQAKDDQGVQGFHAE